MGYQRTCGRVDAFLLRCCLVCEFRMCIIAVKQASIIAGSAVFGGQSTFHQLDLILQVSSFQQSIFKRFLTLVILSFDAQLLGRPTPIDIRSMQSVYAEPTLKQTPIKAPMTFEARFPKVCSCAGLLSRQALIENRTRAHRQHQTRLI